MIFKIFTIITFIAQCVLTIFIISKLVKLDKAILDINDTICIVKDKLKDIASLIKNISEQVVEISQSFVKKLKFNNEEIALRYLSKALLALVLWKINSKTINRIRKSKTFKFIGKGLSLLENMI